MKHNQICSLTLCGRTKKDKHNTKAFEATYKVNVSFQTGFNVALIVFDFLLTPSESGISFIFTYGSLRPLGSIGMRLRLEWDKRKQMEKVLIKSMRRSFPVIRRRCVGLRCSQGFSEGLCFG